MMYEQIPLRIEIETLWTMCLKVLTHVTAKEHQFLVPNPTETKASFITCTGTDQALKPCGAIIECTHNFCFNCGRKADQQEFLVGNYQNGGVDSTECDKYETRDEDWHQSEGQIQKKRKNWKIDTYRFQKGLGSQWNPTVPWLICFRMDLTKTDWHQREGQATKRRIHPKTDSIGAQGGLLTLTMTDFPKELSHLIVQNNGMPKDPWKDVDEKKFELPDAPLHFPVLKDHGVGENVDQTFGKSELFDVCPSICIEITRETTDSDSSFIEEVKQTEITTEAKYSDVKITTETKDSDFEITTDSDFEISTETTDSDSSFVEDENQIEIPTQTTDEDSSFLEEEKQIADSDFEIKTESPDSDCLFVDDVKQNEKTMQTTDSDSSSVKYGKSEKVESSLYASVDRHNFMRFMLQADVASILKRNQTKMKDAHNRFMLRANVFRIPKRNETKMDDAVHDILSYLKSVSRTQRVFPSVSVVFTVISIIERLAMGQQVPAKESMKYEMLRFCTFRQYPPSGKPSTIRLAKAGFYYATNRDEVICYCCAKRISNWKENDDPMLAHRHVTPNCDFLLKNSEVNVPISITDESDVIQRLQRLETDPVFVNQVFNEMSTEALERLNNLLTDAIRTDGPTDDDRNNIDATSNMFRANSAVAKDSIPAGSFAQTGLNSLPPVGAENRKDSDRPYMSLVGYDVNNAAAVLTVKKMDNMTGIMVSNMNILPDFVNTKPVQPTDDSSTDLPRGMSSSSNTASNNSPSTTAISAISQSNMASSQLPSTVTTSLLPRSSQSPAAVNTANSVAGNSAVAVNSAVATTLPKYPKYSTRAARHASFRECQQIAVQMDSLCDAGFFYAGSGDSTRCFFCGIGLRHWSPDDDPWTEHARFSLKCLFVLEQKGQEFINIVKLAVEVSEKASKNAIVANTNTDVMKSEAAVSALAMGYSAEQVRKAIDTINARMQTSAATNGTHQLSGQDILEEIFRMEEGYSTNSTVAITERPESEPDNLEEQGAWAEALPRRSQSDLLPLGSSRLQVQQRNFSDGVVQSDLERKRKQLVKENKMLRSASLCTQCHRREICMVFLPCGHLVTCEECGKATRTCTTCASRVKGTVRTYMA